VCAQRLGDFGWELLGQEVPAGERLPAHIVRPSTPDGERIKWQLYALGPLPQHEDRRSNPPPSGSVCPVMLEVDTRACAVVLADSADRFRSTERLQIGGASVRIDCARTGGPRVEEEVERKLGLRG
jgi:hypothetical protein